MKMKTKDKSKRTYYISAEESDKRDLGASWVEGSPRYIVKAHSRGDAISKVADDVGFADEANPSDYLDIVSKAQMTKSIEKGEKWINLK